MLVKIMGTSKNKKILINSPGGKRFENQEPKVKQARFLEEAKSALFDWQDFIKDFVDLLDQPIIILDSLYKIWYLNNAFIQTFGKDSKSLKTLALSNYLNKQDLDLVKTCLKNIENDTLNFCQHRVSFKNKPANVKVKKLKFKKQTSFIFLIRAENEEGSHSQSNLLGLISHELKTPLTAIKAFGQMTTGFLEPQNQKAKNYLEKIDEQVNRIIELVDDVFDVSKIHLGKFAIAKKKHFLDDLVRETAEEVKFSQAGKHQILIRGSIREKVNVDRNRIKQVLLNIISNAIKYSPKADRVDIKLRQNKKNVEIKIQDYGEGIEPENLENIFSQFYQSKENNGLGLGLYISQKIVREHDGEISVLSQKGQGSIFTIILPIN